MSLGFRKLLGKLPAAVQKEARQAYLMFAENPHHPGLGFKCPRTLPTIRSVRIGLGHRALGRVGGDTVMWFWIGTHAEYTALLKKL